VIDRNVILSVIWILGTIALILSTGIVWIAAHGAQIDAGLSGLDGSVIGAIAGLLTNLAAHKPAESSTAPDPAPIAEPVKP